MKLLKRLLIPIIILVLLIIFAIFLENIRIKRQAKEYISKKEYYLVFEKLINIL